MEVFAVTRLFRFIYGILSLAFSTCSRILGLAWFLCNCCSLLMPWLMMGVLVLCVASRLFRRKEPRPELVTQLLGESAHTRRSFPVYRATGFDAPENSLCAIKMCTASKCPQIVMNLEKTADEWVILSRQTLEKANMRRPIDKITIESLRNFNVSEHHPLGKNFPPQRILTLPNLISEVANLDVTIFLLVPPHLDKYRDQLRQVLAENISVIQKRLVIVSASPVTIYHLKNLEIVCGLWLEQPRPAKQYMSTLNSVKGAFLRNIIAPVTGIKVVFIHKSEFNEQILDLWKGWNVRTIIYPVNIPSEKRYYQRVVKTQYLTDSLRSEPEAIRVPAVSI